MEDILNYAPPEVKGIIVVLVTLSGLLWYMKRQRADEAAKIIDNQQETLTSQHESLKSCWAEVHKLHIRLEQTKTISNERIEVSIELLERVLTRLPENIIQDNEELAVALDKLKEAKETKL